MSVLAAALLFAQMAAIEDAIRKEFAEPLVQCIEVQRNVVCAVSDRGTGDDDWTSEVRLYRGRKVVHIVEGYPGGHPNSIELQNPLHSSVPQVVVGWCCTNRNQPEILYRVINNRLHEIGTYSSGFRSFDEDGDGVDEIVSSGYIGPSDCGPDISISIMKYRHGSYDNSVRSFSDIAHIIAGLDAPNDMTASGERMVLHVVNPGKPGHRVRRLTIRAEGKTVPLQFTESTRTLDVPVQVKTKCAPISAEVEGPDGAELWIFAKEADAPRTSSR